MKTKIFVLLFSFLVANLNAQELDKKANYFLSLLSPELKAETVFPLEDSERVNMHFIPIIRKGPTFHDLDEAQTKAALDLLRASLSAEGFKKTQDIIALENVLLVIEDNQFFMPDGSGRDALNYHFCIFGKPSPKEIWGWRFEGHHISLNFTSTNGQIVSSTPSFLGSNPAVLYVDDMREKEVLKKETELGFQLILSLDKEQLRKAKFSNTAPYDIITGTDVKASGLEPKGISYKDLTDSQHEILMNLLNVYIDNYELGFSKTLRAKIEKAGIENLYFAWAGGMESGVGNYYRIQGPMLLVEYDNTQNHANHIHTVVRDLTNDYAEDILREHYKSGHHQDK